nr:MAG TPA: hypothetical protein [Caudoviricetes sp.]
MGFTQPTLYSGATRPLRWVWICTTHEPHSYQRPPYDIVPDHYQFLDISVYLFRHHLP